MNQAIRSIREREIDRRELRMDIDRDNFLEHYPKIKAKIERASFISFDEEMTGIQINDNKFKISKLDDADIRYNKMTNVANRYAIIQFGLCIFEDNADNKDSYEYTVSPYNFYIFPNSTNMDIIMSPSSIDFLRNNNMDFQKWIGKGLSFVDKHGQAYLEKKYNQNQLPPPTPTTNISTNTNNTADKTTPTTPAAPAQNNTNSNSSNNNLIILTKPHDIEYMERNLKALHNMINNTTSTPTTANLNTTTDLPTNITSNINNKSYTFESTNSFLRAASYKQIDALHLSPEEYTISKNSMNQIVVSKVTSIEEKEVGQNYDL